MHGSEDCDRPLSNLIKRVLTRKPTFLPKKTPSQMEISSHSTGKRTRTYDDDDDDLKFNKDPDVEPTTTWRTTKSKTATLKQKTIARTSTQLTGNKSH